jgi:hypothetical protein
MQLFKLLYKQICIYIYTHIHTYIYKYSRKKGTPWFKDAVTHEIWNNMKYFFQFLEEISKFSHIIIKSQHKHCFQPCRHTNSILFHIRDKEVWIERWSRQQHKSTFSGDISQRVLSAQPMLLKHPYKIGGQVIGTIVLVHWFGNLAFREGWTLWVKCDEDTL